MRSQESKPTRYWQNWDSGHAAKLIDDYWTGSQGETHWRDLLAWDLRCELGANVTVLEIGCGSGLVYGALLRHGVVRSDSYIGGDVSYRMLALARQRYPDAKFCELDILDLPYPDGSQDNVICIDVIQHLPSYDAAVRELIRISGRKLYLSIWFTQRTDDEILFAPPDAKFDGQRFHDNCYSLPRFITFIFSNSNKDISDLRVHHVSGKRYILCAAFVQRIP